MSYFCTSFLTLTALAALMHAHLPRPASAVEKRFGLTGRKRHRPCAGAPNPLRFLLLAVLSQLAHLTLNTP